ncbi:hypothetical protein U0070_001711 [Myodes glareolus]|uniref:Uncharacterized protein n=1 Tax=Myodes glareolus TaxID=447135 RepID=A0AAW0JBW3_MYOGA
MAAATAHKAQSDMNADADGQGGAVLPAQSREGSPVACDFVPSVLGTREQFGEESMNRLIRWMQKHKIPLDASVLDIGTGNGVFLVELVGTFSIHVFEPIFKMKVF